VPSDDGQKRSKHVKAIFYTKPVDGPCYPCTKAVYRIMNWGECVGNGHSLICFIAPRFYGETEMKKEISVR
jgi:hypothetical protein